MRHVRRLCVGREGTGPLGVLLALYEALVAIGLLEVPVYERGL
jgi:hypothetical protein